VNRTRAADRDSVAPSPRPMHPARSLFGNRSTLVFCGAVAGGIMAASPFGFWWLPPATVYALGLILIAAVYIGFSVADGRWKVIAVESSVATVFVAVAAAILAAATAAGVHFH
jgi:hypothetical protein